MRQQQQCELDAILRGWAGQYNNPDFIKSDPIQFPHKYDGRKAEVSGFITAWLSFGNRKAIIEKAGEIDASFMGDPYSWVMARDYRSHFNNHGKIYRFLSHHDMYLLGKRLHELYMSYETMEEYVMSQPDKHLFNPSPNTSMVSTELPTTARVQPVKDSVCSSVGWFVMMGW